MKLTVDGAVFVAECRYEDKDVPKGAGFRWDAARRRWATPEPQVAARLIDFADERAAARLANVVAVPVQPVDRSIVVSYEAGVFVCRCPIEQKDVAKAAGFRWDPTAKRWATNDVVTAAKLARFADANAAVQLADAQFQANQARNASRAVDADVPLPCPEGLSYLGYQRAGIAFGAKKAGVLIADEMGLGKTIQAIGILNVALAELPEATPYRVLVICPASLRLNWKRELEKWLIRKLPVHVVDGGVNRTNDAIWSAVAGKGGIVVVNYDVVAKHRPAIDAIEWDNLTADEAHLLKSPKAQRTQAVLGTSGKKRRAA